MGVAFVRRGVSANRALSGGALAALLVLLAPRAASAETFYVASGGGDDAPGTQALPFASLARAQQSAGPGDTVFVRGGTYAFTSSTEADGVVLDKSGQSGKPITYAAYAGEHPIFDFSGMTALLRITGLRVTGSWLHIKGLEITGVPQRITTANESWGIYNTGSNNVYEMLNLHHNAGPGLFIGKGSNNLVLNCDSHHNYDPLSKAGAGENADGFGCHGSGAGNVFRGCRAWWNTDDGYDFISALGVCVVEHSWAFYNGYMPDTFDAVGNGNGFKAGGYGSNPVPADPPRHTVRFCLAFQNLAAGFYANHHPIGGDWFNNTAYKNARDFDMLVLEPGGNPNHKLRNNLGFGSKTTLANWTGSDDDFNAWTLGVDVSASDFESVDVADAVAPRAADGSLPVVAFMKLRADSDLIDKGEDIGFAYNDAAPDLGAFESGPPVAGGVDAGVGAPGDAGVVGTDAGASGTGGAGGAGGSPTGTGGTGAQSGTGGGASTPNAAGTGGAASGAAGMRAADGSGGATAGDAMTSAEAPASGCACRTLSGPRSTEHAAWSPFAWLALASVVSAWRRLARKRRRD